MKDNLQKKLWESGLLEKGDSSQIEIFKKNHKKEQVQHFSDEHEKTHRKKLISFTEEEFEFLQKQALNYGYKQLSPFLKDVMFAFLTRVHISPDKEQQNEILISVREMKNDVLESMKYIHLNEAVTSQDIQNLISRIDKLDLSIEDKLNSVLPLREWIENQIKKDTLFISKLLQIVSILIKYWNKFNLKKSLRVIILSCMKSIQPEFSILSNSLDVCNSKR